MTTVADPDPRCMSCPMRHLPACVGELDRSACRVLPTREMAAGSVALGADRHGRPRADFATAPGTPTAAGAPEPAEGRNSRPAVLPDSAPPTPPSSDGPGTPGESSPDNATAHAESPADMAT